MLRDIAGDGQAAGFFSRPLGLSLYKDESPEYSHLCRESTPSF